MEKVYNFHLKLKEETDEDLYKWFKTQKTSRTASLKLLIRREIAENGYIDFMNPATNKKEEDEFKKRFCRNGALKMEALEEILEVINVYLDKALGLT